MLKKDFLLLSMLKTAAAYIISIYIYLFIVETVKRFSFQDPLTDRNFKTMQFIWKILYITIYNNFNKQVFTFHFYPV